MVPGKMIKLDGYHEKGVHVVEGPAKLELSLNGEDWVTPANLEGVDYEDLATGFFSQFPNFIRFVRLHEDSEGTVVIGVITNAFS